MAKEGETKRIEALYGPFAGGQIDIPAGDAEQAIADGWARDPYATPDPKAEPKEWTQEGHDAMIKAAEKAARKIRGEAEPKAAKEAKGKEDANADTQAAVGEARERQMEAGKNDNGGYETRQSAKPTTSKKK